MYAAGTAVKCDAHFWCQSLCLRRMWDVSCLTCAGGSQDGPLGDEEQLAFPGGVLAVGGQVELCARRQVGQIGQVVGRQLESSHHWRQAQRGRTKVWYQLISLHNINTFSLAEPNAFK